MFKPTGPVYMKLSDERAAGLQIRAVDFSPPGKSTDIAGGPERGRVNIGVAAGAELPEEIHLFFTQHLSKRSKQRVLAAKARKDISVDLPPGEYTMQILARGFDTFRALVRVDPQRPLTIQAVLKARTRKPSTFAERLAKYGIDANKIELAELTVPPRMTQALNCHIAGEKPGFQMLYADSIAQIKKWIGSDDAKFGHDSPIFGPIPAPENLTPLAEDLVDLRKLTPAKVDAVKAIAREYVHGNSRSVAHYESVLNQAIKRTTREFSLKMFPIFIYRIVTIGAGATLEIGNGSAIFSCDELRIHKTGRLKPVASVSIEIGTYTEFG